MGKNFFDETTERSQVKSKIVSKYFYAWAKVILDSVKRRGGDKIAYIDLFAGPGRYSDGTRSTPLMILEKAIQDNDLRNMLFTVFNDVNTEFSSSLESAITALPGIETLHYQPVVSSVGVGDELKEFFEDSIVPSLFFVDPWGYRGLSLDLINNLIKDWACECIFFFNYNRINMGLTNPYVKEHMDALFGESKANELREKKQAVFSMAEPGIRSPIPLAYQQLHDA